MRTAARARRAGVVLIITLALIALITVVIVAYFSRATTDRRIESAASQAVTAEILARSSAQLILSDIKTELVAGSAPTTAAPPIYRPTTAQQMVPSRALAQAALLTDSNFTSLVKQSGSRFFPTSGYSGTPLIVESTGRDTANPSRNDRVVSAARWNAPVLVSGAGFANGAQLPRWINVDRTGIAPSQSSWSATFRDYSLTNDQAVVGRFAFNVYDVSGLLDANVAGYPVFSTPLTDAQVQQLKSTEAGASLYDRVSSNSIIEGFNVTRQTAFINDWRYASNTAANFSLDFMARTGPPSSTVSATFADSGFMRPTIRNPASTSSSTNTIAYSRQDLLRLTQAASAYLPAAALPYFSHFTRELNAPSWSPTEDAQVLGGSNGIDNVYAYKSNKDTPGAANRDVLNVRVTSAFTRLTDGTQAAPGELLLKTRFPLRRLDGIGNTGVNTGAFPVLTGGTLQTASFASLQRDFGFVWNSTAARWDYVGASAPAVVQPRILTLEEVAQGFVLDSAGAYSVTRRYREPNFFELLKASILSGSLGVRTTAATFTSAETRFGSTDGQIIQIGANTIDQWDADKNPTFIYFGTEEYAGVENLPYLNKLGYQCRWSTSSPVTFRAFLVPSFWTPAQNATAVGTQSTLSPYPTPAVRVIMTGGTARAVLQSSTTWADSTIITGGTAPYLNLTGSASFGPTPNGPGGGTQSGMGQTIDSKYGILFTFPSTNGITAATSVRSYPVIDTANFEMQVQVGGPSGAWKTYQRWLSATTNTSAPTAVCEPPAGSGAAFWTSSTMPIFDPEFVILDPRTMRFGVWESHASGTADNGDYNYGVTETLDRDVNARSPATPASPNFQVVTSLGPQGSSFSGTNVSFAAAEIANNTGTGASYRDQDGVRRRGDHLTSGTSSSALLPTNIADRSPILNSTGRQLRTVAELGAIFRDQPWKTLNFTTADSADAGLLDAFTIFEPNSVFRSDIVAGKISLNTRQAPVLRAILAGVATNTNNSTPLITEPQRNAVVAALLSLTATQPMTNKAELVTRLAPHPAVTGLGNKEAREAVMRALSDVAQTRTWNLMIDTIAQSGRYAANATSLDNFIVEGEKRYWVHVAIDRFTGEIIDRQFEAVNE